MYEVKVKKERLLDILQENRKRHRKIFEKAIAGYREEVILHLDFALEAAKNGEKIITTVRLIQPQDHTADYDRVIGMLDISVDDEIVIDDIQYRQFVLDKWDWSERFSSSSSSYSSSSSKSDLEQLYKQI